MCGKNSRLLHFQEHSWAVCAGDFSILKDFLSEKNSWIWAVFQLVDALLRGFGQVVFANNPISGFLIVVGLAAGAPGTLGFCVTTAFIGLLLSMLIRESQDKVENGLTVYNPLLVGAISYTFFPKIYGSLDAFCYLLILIGTICSVYLTRSLGSNEIPCTVWPFNLTEYALLFALSTQNDYTTEGETFNGISDTDNVTNVTTDIPYIVVENVTHADVNWGMIFRGMVIAPSQLFATENLIVGSMTYLAILIYSPTTAAFSFLGAMIGAFAGLELGVPYDEVYSGFWGFNSLLTGGSLGGNFFVLNAQTTAATLIAIVYTVAVQYAVFALFKKVQLPILTVPFIIVTSLFVKLRVPFVDATFPSPVSISFPEKQRYDYLVARRSATSQQELCTLNLILNNYLAQFYLVSLYKDYWKLVSWKRRPEETVSSMFLFISTWISLLRLAAIDEPEEPELIVHGGKRNIRASND